MLERQVILELNGYCHTSKFSAHYYASGPPEQMVFAVLNFSGKICFLKRSFTTWARNSQFLNVISAKFLLGIVQGFP